MDLKQVVLNLRVERNLKGKYPVVVKIPSNMGGICNKKGFYVMTLYQDKNLYFHGLSSFGFKYKPKKDFAISLDSFRKYVFIPYGKKLRKITLINGQEFMPIHFFSNVPTSYEGECNAATIAKVFDKLGIKEVLADEIEGEIDEE